MLNVQILECNAEEFEVFDKNYRFTTINMFTPPETHSSGYNPGICSSVRSDDGNIRFSNPQQEFRLLPVLTVSGRAIKYNQHINNKYH